MASSNMDMTQAEAFITSQTKKKDSALTENHGKVFLKVWGNQKNKIHEQLIQKCTWSNKLKNITWRIDLKSSSRHDNQLNEPSAIMELQLESNRSQVGTWLQHIK